MKVAIVNNLKVGWHRLTANRLTITFILLSLVYCVLQSVFAIKSLLINDQIADTIKSIYTSQDIAYLDFVHYSRQTGVVHVCQTNDQALNYTACTTVWPLPPTANRTTLNAIASTAPKPNGRRSLQVQRSAPDQKGQHTMFISGLKGIDTALSKADTISASPTCMQVMKWPLQTLLNGKREDIAFVFFQAWVFGLSVVAVLNQSVPHVIATLITHLLVVIWSSWEYLDTFNFQADYNTLVLGINAPGNPTGEYGKPGACDGQDFLPNYFGPRKTAQLVVALINFLGLIGSIFFTYKLYHSFGWQSFKRIGASVLVNRLYRLALTLFILIQLTFFFVVVAMGLWVDQMYNGLFGSKARQADVYKAGHVIVFILLVPWLVLGWISVRREMRKCMLLFIALSFLFILAWIGECFSQSWRLTYIHWTFFSSMQTCAIILTVATFIAAVLCRIYCFGHGLSQYLQYQVDDVSGDLNPAPDVIHGFDRIDFPSLQALGDEERGQGLGQHHRTGSETTLTNNNGGAGGIKEVEKTEKKRSSFDTLEGEEDAVELPGSDEPQTTARFSSIHLTPGPLGTEVWGNAATTSHPGRV
ncbi:hypothetical protein M408DRAFT_134031 [Serendipita vermifera MAFF 305830]|uniref:Integral membrane protein n=1 Tax=Serendipita vermifera MAFF 305830 TaxID=933852 RepID=A0A0C3BBJ6_SERVB|nr:hypothetical protein M408DRAFT_134031 [Serendipita vermifera MAFF 305830]